jgi:hypothetical protein
MAKTSGGVVTWVPVRAFPERDLHDFTPQQYCAQPLEAFRVGHPAMAPRVQCLPMGVRPQ